ncbi:hypothetical protein [Defluviimonas sp. SAOS-178_SWC]|uniref:hypothetical protein n=1 Tax=Defluviimonas sp. SAOS-178_SWC TaxID=3121287 RepID=UPI0032217C87
MTPDHWLAVLSRITPEGPVDLDAGAAPPARFGAGLGGWSSDTPPPSPRLWEREDSGAAYLGIRVDAPLPDPARTALRLAAAALERGVTPIILTSLGQSGFDRFGFRVERFVPGDGVDRAAWEAEMTAFWSLALIIDAADVAALG